MRYPGNYENIIDVTKPPYNADNGLFEVENSDFLLLGSRIEGVSEDKNSQSK